VALAVALVCSAATAPAVTAAHVAKPESAGPARFFHGSVAAKLLQDDELADLRAAALPPSSVQRPPKRKVILWDEAHGTEVTLPENTDAGNSIVTRGLIGPAELFR
jgi:hypothetical protein